MTEPTKKVCTTCGKGPVRARGLCAAHYSQERRKEAHEKKGPQGAHSQLRDATAVKREGTPKGKGPSQREKKVARTLGGLLTLTNEVLKGAVKPPWPLTEPEVDLLARRGAPVVLESKTLTAWVEKLDGAGGPRVQFGAALLVVVLPRAVEAKLIPAEQAQMVFGVALAIALADPDEFEEPAEEGEPNREPMPVDTGATVEVEAHVGAVV